MADIGDKTAALDDVATFARNLPDTYLLCRINNRHIADPSKTKVTPPTRHEKTYILEGPCLICGQSVRKTYDEDYGRVRTSLAVGYNDDYLMPRGSGRIDANGRRILVGEFMQRTTGKPKRRRRASKAATPANVTPISSAMGA